MTKSLCIADDMYGKIVSKNPETQTPHKIQTFSGPDMFPHSPFTLQLLVGSRSLDAPSTDKFLTEALENSGI